MGKLKKFIMLAMPILLSFSLVSCNMPSSKTQNKVEKKKARTKSKNTIRIRSGKKVSDRKNRNLFRTKKQFSRFSPILREKEEGKWDLI